MPPFVAKACVCLVIAAAPVSCGSNWKRSQPLATTTSTMATAPVTCPDIAFVPQSDNMAAHIVATGADCIEAHALVREVAAQHTFMTGPREFRSGVFTCSVVTEEAAVPVGHYACIDGPKKVTWDKT
jgi:hypothetical protein